MSSTWFTSSSTLCQACSLAGVCFMCFLYIQYNMCALHTARFCPQPLAHLCILLNPLPCSFHQFCPCSAHPPWSTMVISPWSTMHDHACRCGRAMHSVGLQLPASHLSLVNPNPPSRPHPHLPEYMYPMGVHLTLLGFICQLSTTHLT